MIRLSGEEASHAPRPERSHTCCPTYKIRGGEYYFRGARVFPSYLQAGPSFFIEKSKRRMIAEDIAAALAVAHAPESEVHSLQTN